MPWENCEVIKIYVFDQNGIKYKKYGYHTPFRLTGKDPDIVREHDAMGEL